MNNRKISDITLRIDRIRIEMQEIGRFLGSISPKLSIYKENEKKLEKLNEELNRLKKERSQLSLSSVVSAA